MKRSFLTLLVLTSAVFAQQPNGTCLTAQAVGVGTTFTTNDTEPTALDASAPAPTCRTAAVRDVWYTFTANNTGNHIISTCPNPGDPAPVNNDTVLQVLNGTCGAFTQLGCSDDFGCGPLGYNSQVSVALSASVTYYVRVCSWSAFDPQGAFGLTIIEPTPPPVNDVCSGAIPVSGGVNGPFSNVFASPANDVGFSTPSPCNAGSTGGRDLFYTYTPACDGTVTIETCGGNNVNEPGVLFDSQITVYDVWTCGAPNTPIACNDDAGGATCGLQGWESRVNFPVLAGATYLVRVAGYGSAVGSFNLTITLSTAQIAVIGTGCGTPPATLAGSGPPVMGSTGTITVTAQPNANGVLLFSNPNTAMAYTPFGACTIYVQNPGMGILLPIFTDGAGAWSLTVTFPMDPAFDCVGWDFQGLVIGAAGIEFTNGLRLIIGT